MEEIAWKDLLGWGDEQIEDLRFIGYSYIKEGKYDIARTFFEALIAINPTELYDLQTLGGLYLELGKGLAALEILNQALEIDGAHAPTLLNRIKTLLQLGHKREALEEARKLALHPDTRIANEAEALLLAYS